MDRNEIIEKIKKVFMEMIHVDDWGDIPYDKFCESLGIDSMVSLKLIVKLEQEFDVEISDGNLEIESLFSINHLADYILSQQEGK